VTPGETYSSVHNAENTELYAIFPYLNYTCLSGSDDRETALNTWRHRGHPEDGGWQQNVIQAPLLGLAQEAKQMEISRSRGTAPGYRFPAFFGPNYDWTPDQDHASNMLTGLQRMLMQCQGKRIVLLPAWPKDWNCHFKLHAPGNTTVEATVENGTVANLVVTPNSRRKDVEIRPAQ
jgi:hypothetical protein